MYITSDNLTAVPVKQPDLVPPPLLRPAFKISTRHVARDSIWHEIGGSLVEFVASDMKTDFVAEQTAWDLGGVALTRTIVPATNFARTARQLRADSIDHWILSATRRGSARTVGSGRVSNDAPGKLTVQSLRSEFEGQTTDLDAVHLFVPRDFGRDAAASLDAADNTEIRSALGLLLTEYLLNVERRLPLMTVDEVPGLLTSIQAMILACLQASPDGLFEARNAIETTLLERARQTIQRQLFSPTLGAQELCRELGVSRSRLYRMFEPLGGVVHYIRHRRLLDAHAALSNPDDTRTIVEIAAERGFMEAAEFSRTFKREFGYRPTDARNHTRAPAWRRRNEIRLREGDGKLANLLRRLQ